MQDRRAFLKAGAAACAYAACPPAFAAWPAAPPRPGLPLAEALVAVVVDRTLVGARAFASSAAAHGTPVHVIEGDAGGVWMNALEPRLRDAPAAIAGLTAPATLFCLELLARDYGMRLVHRTPQAPRMAGACAQAPGAVWVLAPDPASPAPLSLAGRRRDRHGPETGNAHA